MSADMKTLREALDTLSEATDNGAGGGAANCRAVVALDAALDELEALRSERELSLASVVDAQRDELLAALEAMCSGYELGDSTRAYPAAVLAIRNAKRGAQ